MLGVTDDILGDGFLARAIPLGGGARATLVHRPSRGATRGAILYVHGFSDYFFQRHVAEHFAERGFAFYAVDLRGYGRSLRDGELPNFVTDLAIHFEELDAAIDVVRGEDGHPRVVMLGHSTGGLIASLWAHHRRADDGIDALVLNSPWLELAEPWPLRTVGTSVIRGLGRIAPTFVVRAGLGPVYGHSIHAEHHGEWDFNLAWKPLNGFPVRAGWLRAIRHGHARLHRGLDVRVPVLVLRSTRSLLHGAQWSPRAMTADTVLDVRDMARYAPKIGSRVTVSVVDNGLHDLFLSAPTVRAEALSIVDKWLGELDSASDQDGGPRDHAEPTGRDH